MKARHPTLPGYRPLRDDVTGAAADMVRFAERLAFAHELESACMVMEQALAQVDEPGRELPGWLCGRLAALYRALERYDEEVMLLERYRESQADESAKRRYDARLSKARLLASRRRPRNELIVAVRKAVGGQ